MTNKNKMNGSADLLAKALRDVFTDVFEAGQNTAVELIADTEERLEKNIGERIDSLDAEIKGVKEQVNGMSKKLDKMQDRQ